MEVNPIEYSTIDWNLIEIQLEASWNLYNKRKIESSYRFSSKLIEISCNLVKIDVKIILSQISSY